MGGACWPGGTAGEEGEAGPQDLTVSCPAPACPHLYHFEEEGSPQPVRASEGPAGGKPQGQPPAPSLDSDFGVLSQLLRQGVAVLGGLFSQV